MCTHSKRAHSRLLNICTTWTKRACASLQSKQHNAEVGLLRSVIWYQLDKKYMFVVHIYNYGACTVGVKTLLENGMPKNWFYIIYPIFGIPFLSRVFTPTAPHIQHTVCCNATCTMHHGQSAYMSCTVHDIVLQHACSVCSTHCWMVPHCALWECKTIHALQYAGS